MSIRGSQCISTSLLRASNLFRRLPESRKTVQKHKFYSLINRGHPISLFFHHHVIHLFCNNGTHWTGIPKEDLVFWLGQTVAVQQRTVSWRCVCDAGAPCWAGWAGRQRDESNCAHLFASLLCLWVSFTDEPVKADGHVTVHRGEFNSA